MTSTPKRFLQRAAIALLVTAPFGVQAETLRDALIGAYTHSGLLDQNRALLRAADEDVAAAQAALRPIINWSADITRRWSESRNALGLTESAQTSATIALQGQLLLWDGGRSKLSVEAAKETVLATRQQLINIEQNVLLRAVSAYFGVREAAENVALRQSNLRLIREELRAAEDRFDVGEVTRTDVAQAQARLAEARAGLAAAMGALVQAQEEYANIVGHKPGQLAAPGKLPRVGGNIKAAKAEAVRNHPLMKQVQHQVAAAELNILNARAARNPTIRLEGSISNREVIGSSDFSENASIGITASGPIYQGGALASATRSAIAARDAARGNLHVVRHNIRQNVGNAYAQLQSADAQIQATDQRIRAARVAFRGVREEATLGARTTLDVLNAEQALLNAQAARIAAEADRYVAAYSVLAAKGQLTATGLRLGVQQYDPTAYYNLVKKAPTARSKQGQKLDRVLRAIQKD